MQRHHISNPTRSQIWMQKSTCPESNPINKMRKCAEDELGLPAAPRASIRS
ncbi:hypothetical protein DsansV1_C13g0121251 [Dioscorea sansibarensis]